MNVYALVIKGKVEAVYQSEKRANRSAELWNERCWKTGATWFADVQTSHLIKEEKNGKREVL